MPAKHSWKHSMKQILRRVSVYARLTVRKAKRVSFIGFDGVPIYDVVAFFGRGLIRGSITTRASAVAFDFFVAIFPTIIFLFTLIPYIPVSNFQQQLLELVEELLPITAFSLVESTLTEVVTQRSWGLLSFGFIAAVFFAHNGVSSLINAFNATYHTIETRGFVNQHLIAFFLTFLLPLLLTLGVMLVLFGQFLLDILVQKEFLQLNFTYYVIVVIRWFVIVCIFFFSISLLYYMAPAKRTKFRFISAGSIMATAMILVTSLGFSFYVNNFGQYNKLYGSIGSLLALMIWIFFNAIGLIVGFEINASIASAKSSLTKKLSYEETEHIGHS
ncbi:YihY/virulence factor BrkB family protein [Perlabentimonas gracilis]|uniref:YihY/virulence factor BrkB family protein n=1 Tax=Perlabentimonas gracilis TaxID=2715279 RepID=UPI00140DB336|nr:YihY/virulence factor BrkB family protein [Perlabentimonas gracilis]NHB69695.1 YihY/virulence factor BrkB family protein [Perlabentimonas gracilis]